MVPIIIFLGIMAARGLLQNPALFAGYEKTPVSCIQDWVTLAVESGMPFQCFHHHLVFMLEKVLPKNERKIFNVFTSTNEILTYLKDYFNIEIPNRDNMKFNSNILYKDKNIKESNYFVSKTSQLPFEDYLNDSRYLFGE